MTNNHNPIEPSDPYALQSAHVEQIVVAGKSGTIGGVVAVVGIVLLIVSAVGSVGFFAILGALGLVGGGILFARGAAENSRWEPIDFHFSEWELGPGFTPTVTVHRRSKKSVPDVPNILSKLTLTCIEEIRYRQGTQTKTQRDKISFDFPLTGSISGNAFVGRSQMQVPVDHGGPTLDLSNNKVYWELSLDISGFSTVGGDVEVGIFVAPILGRDFVKFVDAPPPPSAPPFGPGSA